MSLVFKPIKLRHQGIGLVTGLVGPKELGLLLQFAMLKSVNKWDLKSYVLRLAGSSPAGETIDGGGPDAELAEGQSSLNLQD